MAESAFGLHTNWLSLLSEMLHADYKLRSSHTHTHTAKHCLLYTTHQVSQDMRLCDSMGGSHTHNFDIFEFTSVRLTIIYPISSCIVIVEHGTCLSPSLLHHLLASMPVNMCEFPDPSMYAAHWSNLCDVSFCQHDRYGRARCSHSPIAWVVCIIVNEQPQRESEVPSCQPV